MPAVSIYLKDNVLERLDAIVEKQASHDRAAGLSGRKVASRSSVIEQMIESYEPHSGLSLDEITYHVVNLAQEYGAKSVSLFGSFARGEQTASSDIDILLDKGKIKGMQVLDFQEELSQRVGRKVDVVTTAGASERFLRRIKNDCVELYRTPQGGAAHAG